jgi:LysM repeat protein
VSAARQFYEIKSGETLSIIAGRFAVPITAIIELNGLENPDDIQAGQVIEIPTGVVLVTELPEPAAETSAP